MVRTQRHCDLVVALVGVAGLTTSPLAPTKTPPDAPVALDRCLDDQPASAGRSRARGAERLAEARDDVRSAPAFRLQLVETGLQLERPSG